MVALVQLDFDMWHACESWAPQHNLHIDIVLSFIFFALWVSTKFEFFFVLLVEGNIFFQAGDSDMLQSLITSPS